MADNRMYLMCRACGEKMFLGKRLGIGYYWKNYSGDETHLEDKINAFFEQHVFCDGAVEAQPDGVDGWPDIFDIWYEDTPYWQEKGEDNES